MTEKEKSQIDYIIKKYEAMDINNKDQAELYKMVSLKKDNKEIIPYYYTMKYLGLGVSPKKDALKELKKIIGKKDYILGGLYYDLLLFERDDPRIYDRLLKLEEKGYTNVYLKELTHLPNKQSKPYASQDDFDLIDYLFVGKAKHPLMESYEGTEFTADFDSIKASMWLDVINGGSWVKIVSQIFKDNTAYSDEYVDEFILDEFEFDYETSPIKLPEEPGVYEWRLTINGIEKSNEFTIYPGKIDPFGIDITSLKTYDLSSEEWFKGKYNRRPFTEEFDQTNLEYVCSEASFKPLDEPKNIRIYIRVINTDTREEITKLEDIIHLDAGQDSIYVYLYSNSPGKWQRGHYQYTLSFYGGNSFTGTFRVE